MTLCVGSRLSILACNVLCCDVLLTASPCTCVYLYPERFLMVFYVPELLRIVLVDLSVVCSCTRSEVSLNLDDWYHGYVLYLYPDSRQSPMASNVPPSCCTC